MAVRLPIRFPIFAPILDPNSNSDHQRPPTEVRFSRWNNANAEKFNQRRRTQQEIEDEIRRERRFNSATKIVSTDDGSAPPTLSVETFRSIGTRSAPSRPSIPGKKSKYSKPPKPRIELHPAFRFSDASSLRDGPVNAPANVKIGEDGVSYVIDGAPFEFKYSYTETPKVKPIKMREAPFVPFGPTTMPRPWTGRAPLPPSKKKLKEFDSFVLPPPHKKGVKPVQSPGPFLPGSGPRYVYSREQILGEPLTQEEINDLVKGCMKTNRQLNIGRDGLTHNMLDNIHAHWKRRRVCKIKCKGVCTVDMDNVCEQLEERTGGKIIYRKGGVLYLFRGRNYNYKTRPRFPLMLWKPVPPIYPRLIKRVPEGLTPEEATEMRNKGRKLVPICKLGKNGVYCDLVKNVREAFEECELARINCQGLNASDYRKIGAKLRDLVPCVLLSFENEHILLWRGHNWKSSLQNLDDADGENSNTTPPEAQEVAAPCVQKNDVEHVEVTAPSVQKNDVEHVNNELHDIGVSSSSGHVSVQKVEVPYPTESSNLYMSVVTDELSLGLRTYKGETTTDVVARYGDSEASRSSSLSVTILDHNINSHGECSSEAINDSGSNEAILDDKDSSDGLSPSISRSDSMLETGDNYINVMVDPDNGNKMLDPLEATDVNRPSRPPAPCTEGVLLLLKEAVEEGSALVLDDESLDADNIYQRTVAFAKSAPPGPVFRLQSRKVWVHKKGKQRGGNLEREVLVETRDEQQGGNLETKETTTVSMKGKREKTSKIGREEFDDKYLNVVPQGTLGVDELAKLLT